MELKSKTVLVVDDEPDLLSIFSEYFRPYFSVHTANNGADALHVFQSQSVDFILSDIDMPEMNGITLLKKFVNYLNIYLSP